MTSVSGATSASNQQSSSFSESSGGGSSDNDGPSNVGSLDAASANTRTYNEDEQDKPGNGTTNDSHPLASEPSTTDRLRDAEDWTSALSSDTTTDTRDVSVVDLNPLAGPASMAARREFNGVPLRSENSLGAYRGMTADDFAGPTDMRLEQLSRSVRQQNTALRDTLLQGVEGTDIEVSARAKTPFSTFGKLREENVSVLGDIRDLSGARLDVTPTRPDFVDVYEAQSRANHILGDDLTPKRDYIQNPTDRGYTGRVHSTLTEANGLVHEVQVGPRDLSNFIDQPLTTSSGSRISLHDATLYKGQINGVSLSPELQAGYPEQMRNIVDVNRTGQSLSEVPAAQRDVQRYAAAVEEALPDSINRPAPQLSTRALVGNVASRGFGVLGVAGGGMQAYDGINTLRSGGDTVEGLANTGAGTTSIVSAGALLTGRVALGTTTGGVVAVVDGGRDIYTGLRDGNTEQTLVGTVKAGAGTAMIAGVATANPLLIAGGAVAYTGAVVYESREAIGSAASSAWNWATSWL